MSGSGIRKIVVEEAEVAPESTNYSNPSCCLNSILNSLTMLESGTKNIVVEEVNVAPESTYYFNPSRCINSNYSLPMSGSGIRDILVEEIEVTHESSNRQTATADLNNGLTGVTNGASNQNFKPDRTMNIVVEEIEVTHGSSSRQTAIADLNNGLTGVTNGASNQNFKPDRTMNIVVEEIEVTHGSSSRQTAIADLNNGLTGVTNGASNQNSKPDMIILRSCDGTEFKVPIVVAEQSGMVKSVLADGFTDCMPLPAIHAPVVELMIQFWTRHLGSDKFTKESKEAVQDWDKSFFDNMDQEMLLEFLLAANYMDAKEMLDRSSQYVADTIKDMSVEDVRDYFGLVNDFTPEEEQKVYEENKWAFE